MHDARVRFAVLVAALAACRTQAVGPTQSVVALAGPLVAESGATIVSHTADGTILDSETADASGRAAVVYEPGAYVSAVFPAVAAKTGTMLLPFLLDGVAGHPDLNQRDGIHPTAAGAQIVADHVWKLLSPLL